MIGQKDLLEKINSYTLEILPKALMLIGKKGCGKHTITKLIANNLNINLVDVPNTITNELIVEYQQSVIPQLYVIDICNFSEKQQNQLLKFIEEPSKYTYVIILAESENNIITTILNRCIKHYFLPYTKQELQEIRLIDINNIYDICETPGQLLDIDITNFNKLYTLCTSITKKSHTASFANTLSIATRLNYKEEYNKFDPNLFFDTLAYVSKKDYLESKTNESYLVYCITNKYRQKLNTAGLNKENLVLTFLNELHSAVRVK